MMTTAPAEDLWGAILADVSTQSSRSAIGNKTKNILVLGDEGAGKSTMVANMKGRKLSGLDPQGVGLEYSSIEAHDAEEDIVGRIGLYTVNGNQENSSMLQAVLSKETLADTLVMIVVDLSRPWTIPDSLERWASVLSEHIESLEAGEVLDALKEAQKTAFQSYSEEEEEEEEPEMDGKAAQVLLGLDEGTLTKGLGVPMIVVGAKDDTVAQLQEDRDFQTQHLDFIQLHIREFCLKYGAGLIYTGRAQMTAETFYRYIMHVAYGFPCSDKACIAESAGLFIPSGWDNPTKISVLAGSFSTISRGQPYGDVIKSNEVPASGGGVRAVARDDEQEFLERQREAVMKVDPSAGRTSAASPLRRTAARQAASPSTTAGKAHGRSEAPPGRGQRSRRQDPSTSPRTHRALPKKPNQSAAP